MRAALWLLALFGVAVAAALFAGNNQGTVTLYWPPYRIDLSLNMVVLLLVGGFVTVYAALRALAALLALPHQARRWRVQQKERAMHGALLDALTHMLGGRFIRSRKAAAAALSQEHALEANGEAVPHGKQLRALAHMIAAEASHALQDRATRESHLQDALQEAPMRGSINEQEMHEGAQMRAARWSLDDRDANAALDRLAALPQGAARRTLALRIKLKATWPPNSSTAHTTPPSCSRSGCRWRPASATCPNWPSMLPSGWPHWAAMPRRCVPGCCPCGTAWWSCPMPWPSNTPSS